MSYDLPPPKYWQVFEDLCCDLFRRIWKDPGAQKNGRTGQVQAGVDVYGRCGGEWAGVQCKKKDELAGSELTVEEIEVEVGKARIFEPSLSSFVIATTGLKDQKLQRKAREISDRERFEVQIASWEDLTRDLLEHPRVLSKYYPQMVAAELREMAKAKKAYLQTLWDLLSPLHLAAISERSVERRPIPLISVYTALDVSRTIGVGSEKRRAGLEELIGESLIRDEAYTHVLLERLRREAEAADQEDGYSRQLSAIEVAAGASRLVLVGPAGSGKSTFVKFLALSLAGEALGQREADVALLNQGEPGDRIWPHGALLPVFVELRKFVASELFPKAKEEGVADHLLDYIGSEMRETVRPGFMKLLEEALLEEQGALIILDGLDETPGAESVRERLRQVVSSLSRRYPQSRLILTCRPYAYEPASPWRLDDDGFRETQLAPFDRPKIEAFVTAWYAQLADRGQIDRELAGKRSQKLLRELEAASYLAPISERPLMLTMMADLHASSGGRLPGGRAGLYERSVVLLLDRWNESRGLLKEQTLSEHLGMSDLEIRFALEQLAYEVHRDQGAESGEAGEISDSDLFKALDNRRRPASECKVDERGVMEYLHQRSGILFSESPSRFRFPHRSYQEYLAACHLTRTNFPSLLLDGIGEDPALWREVLLLSVGKIAETPFTAWALLDGLVDELPESAQSEHPGFLKALYAGLAVWENRLWQDVQNQDASKLERVRTWLERALVEGALSPQDRAEAGRVLSVLGDRRPGVGVDENGVPAIDWVEIPKGRFVMGSPENDEGPWDGTPQVERELPAFRIARYPVTNVQYRAFVQDGGYTETWRHCWTKAGWRWKADREGPDDTSRSDFLLDNHPRVNVSWFEAWAFCRWLSEKLGLKVHLPTDAQWEKAARGTDGRIYPWGARFEAAHLNVYETGIGHTTAVGSFPSGASPCGILDMSGNVWEWCRTQWRSSYEAPAVDGPEGMASRVVRGGSFFNDHQGARCAARSRYDPGLWVRYFGCRVSAP